MKRLILILALAVMVGCSSDDAYESPILDKDCHECFALDNRNSVQHYADLKCVTKYRVVEWMDEEIIKNNYIKMTCTNLVTGEKYIRTIVDAY